MKIRLTEFDVNCRSFEPKKSVEIGKINFRVEINILGIAGHDLNLLLKRLMAFELREEISAKKFLEFHNFPKSF